MTAWKRSLMPNRPPYRLPELHDADLLDRLKESHRVINNWAIDAINGDLGHRDAISLIHAEADWMVAVSKKNRNLE